MFLQCNHAMSLSNVGQNNSVDIELKGQQNKHNILNQFVKLKTDIFEHFPFGSNVHKWINSRKVFQTSDLTLFAKQSFKIQTVCLSADLHG